MDGTWGCGNYSKLNQINVILNRPVIRQSAQVGRSREASLISHCGDCSI